MISVIAEGVESVIEDIDPDDVYAYIDLTNFTIGTHTVKVNVESADPRIKYIASATIEVIISN